MAAAHLSAPPEGGRIMALGEEGVFLTNQKHGQLSELGFNLFVGFRRCLGEMLGVHISCTILYNPGEELPNNGGGRRYEIAHPRPLPPGPVSLHSMDRTPRNKNKTGTLILGATHQGWWGNSLNPCQTWRRNAGNPTLSGPPPPPNEERLSPFREQAGPPARTRPRPAASSFSRSGGKRRPASSAGKTRSDTCGGVPFGRGRTPPRWPEGQLDDNGCAF